MMVSSGKVQTLELGLLTPHKIVWSLEELLCCLREPAVVHAPKILFYF